MMNLRSSTEALVARALDTPPGATMAASGDAAIVGVSGAAAVASALRTERYGVIGFVVIRFPYGDLWALRFALGPNDDVRRHEAIALFAALGDLVARGRCPVIVGERGASSHRLGEPAFAAWFAPFAHQQMRRPAATDDELRGAWCEATEDGDTTLPLIVCESPAWTDPAVLARGFMPARPGGFGQGAPFAVAEIGPGGVRLHRLACRAPAAMAMRGALIIRADANAAAGKEKE